MYDDDITLTASLDYDLPARPVPRDYPGGGAGTIIRPGPGELSGEFRPVADVRAKPDEHGNQLESFPVSRDSRQTSPEVDI
jgi:hypothetical protein